MRSKTTLGRQSALMLCTCSLLTLAMCKSHAEVLTFDLHREKVEAQTVETQVGGVTAKAASPVAKVDKKTTTDSTVTVGVSPEMMSVETDGQRRVWDFKRHRIRQANLSDKTYTDSSLYADVDFRLAELQNRFFLQKVMQKIERADKKAFFDPFYSEAMFSVVLPDTESKPEVVESEEGSTKIFKYKDEIVTSFSPGDQELTKALLPQFRRFLLYNCTIHPTIREKIEASGKVPMSLSYYLENLPLGTTRSTFTLKSLTADAPTDVPADFKKVLTKDHPLKPIYEELDKRGYELSKTLKTETLDFFNKAKTEERYLDAFLSLIEYSLITGRQLEEQLTEMRPHTRSDLDIREFAKGFSKPSGEEEAETALAALDSLDRNKLQKGYLLDIFRANIISLLKQNDVNEFKTTGEKDVEACFLKVLKVNPHIVGVYHDLGTWYHERYQMDHAWDAWNLGKQLCPDHPMMTLVSGQAKAMEKNFPEFFTAQEEVVGEIEVVK